MAGAEAAVAAATAAGVGVRLDMGVIAGLAGLAETGRLGWKAEILDPVPSLEVCCAARKD